MKKRFLSMFSALCLALTLLPPMTAQAAESSPVEVVYIGGTDGNETGESVGKKLDSSTPYYHNGTDGALGTADNDPTNANATFDPNSGTLTLNGLDIRTANKGIWWKYNSSGKHDLTIDLAAGTTNKVENTAGAAILGDSGLSSGGPSLIIKGSGTLNVSGSTSGIWVWQNVTIQDDAKVNVKGTTKFGICNNNSSGKITIKDNAVVETIGATYGIGYDNSDSKANIPVIQGGTVTITGGTAAVKVKNGSTESSPNLSGYTVCRVIVGDAAPGTDWNNTTPLSTYKYLKIEPTTHSHSWSDTWSCDDNYHWHNCGNDCYVTDNSSKKGYAEHTVGTAATCKDKAVCSVCGLSYGSVDSSKHTGGTATCKEQAVCSECSQSYGSVDSSNHTGGTTIRGKVDATATTPGYTGDTYCLGCSVKIATGTTIPATGNTGGSNTLESTTFSYAYDVQRFPAFPMGAGGTMNLFSLNKPLLEDRNRKDVCTGAWTLTKAGTYSYLKIYLENKNMDTQHLESIVSDVASVYSLSEELKDKIVIHELKDGGSHIAYGVVIAYDTDEDRAVFIGDTWDGGAGYLLSKTALSESSELGYTVTAQMIATDFTPVAAYQIVEGMNGKWTTNSNETLSFRADGDINKFLGVNLDGALVDPQNYTAVSGSTIVTLKEDYLRTLSAGTHQLTVVYNDGQCSTNFKIQAAVNAPEDDDDTPDPGNSGDNQESNDSPTAPDNTATEKPAIVIHIVQRGDTLRAIARSYGCTVAEIMAANSNLIKNVNLIYPGWQLKIPQSGVNANQGSIQQAVLPNDGKTQIYIVQTGDNLWTISRKHGCTIAEIVALNSRLAANPNLIYAGWELKLPLR